jgi:hypothetical protein
MKTIALALMAAALLSGVGAAQADPALCQKQIIKQLLKFEKVYLKANAKCIDTKNKLGVPSSCPDATASTKLAKVVAAVDGKIATNCTMPDLATLGFPGNCAFEAATQGIEAACAALPVTTVGEFTSCLRCWKGAELSEYLAVLYASQALEVCDGDLGESSAVCSDLDCPSPLPDQRNLGDTAEGTCQKGIGKAGIKYLVTRAKTLGNCALLGMTSAQCLADGEVQAKLLAAQTKRGTVIQNKCGNRDPVPSTPFCCKTTGNDCVAAADRTDCTVNLSGQVQEGKECGLGGTCDTVPGNQFTWWANCPESATCPGASLVTLDDAVGCVDTTAGAIVDELLCLQLRGNGGADWPCPPADGSPAAAFLD